MSTFIFSFSDRNSQEQAGTDRNRQDQNVTERNRQDQTGLYISYRKLLHHNYCIIKKFIYQIGNLEVRNRQEQTGIDRIIHLI